MSQVILVAHGYLGVEMKKSAEMICGQLDNFKAISFTSEDGLESLSLKIKEVVQSYDGDTLIFTDIFCGTPYNASCSICMQETDKNIEVVSGMSLPIILELAMAVNNMSSSELVILIKRGASEVVKSFNDQEIEDEEDF